MNNTALQQSLKNKKLGAVVLEKSLSLYLSPESIIGNVHPTAPAFDEIWVSAWMIGNFAWRKLAWINNK